MSADKLRLHLGCGMRRKEGYVNVDRIEYPHVDVVTDLRDKWPWEDNSVDEVLMEHTFEHFYPMERVHIINEMYRVMRVGAKAKILCPIWSSARAYGDPTHVWPPVSEWTAAYWNKVWRMKEAPHTDASVVDNMYNCNFFATCGYGLDPEMNNRSKEYQEMAMKYWKEAARDIVFSLTKLAPEVEQKLQPL
jgi:hypothetical protein